MTRPLPLHDLSASQRGVALVVSLLLLVVITLLSITAMRSANLDTKIAINHQHKQLAFQSAENALTKLVNLKGDDMKDLDIPGTENESTTNDDWYTNQSEGETPDLLTTSDLSMKLIEVSQPGKYKFSGFGLNIITILYQADAIATIENTNATAHNRMEVALIRE